MKISDPFQRYDLIKARQHNHPQNPFPHQNLALDEMQKWFDKPCWPDSGGIVVLPTGGGKTFTAVRFLCTSVISKGYKVLWLAHTHHLLDQAFAAFEKSVATIPEPAVKLDTRVVSGTPGHCHVRDIVPTDDVVVATLQSTTLAYQQNHPMFMRFLEAAGDRLCVVFDEAHHAPAPSYRKLLKAMKTAHTEMVLIGLTATPTYGNETKNGRLKELFPQGIIHQSKARDLLANKILARPNFEKIPTKVEAEFDQRQYENWVNTYRDLPEDIIESLAKNKDRNAMIAKHYIRNRQKYGKTIIFAERWHQCEQIASFLTREGIRADSVYSKIDGSLPTPEARNARKASDNRRILEMYKNGELEVLLNVRMLTEGTDVPLTQTVFLTRQTTSVVLLTQMVGRALRGPKAGGTEEAYIVSFEDEWKQKINWAGFEQLSEGTIVEDEKVYRKRPPVQLISIDLVRRLAAQMNSGVNICPVSFLKLMPIGWFSVEFQALVTDSEDVETVRQLVMVFEDQEEGYRQYLDYLLSIDLNQLDSESVTILDAEQILDHSIEHFFPKQGNAISQIDRKDLFHIARHVAQNDHSLPHFFRFEERQGYDLDVVAKKHIEHDLGQRQVNESLTTEFHRLDRYWRSLYPTYQLFKTQYDACVNRLLLGSVLPPPFPPPEPQATVGREPTAEQKRQVKSRDGYRCLCCGERNRQRLQVDHIAPWYFGGQHSLENLQTLCKICNGEKDRKKINFRIHRDHTREVPEADFPPIRQPSRDEAGDADFWAQSLRRAINFFYGAAAVDQIKIGRKGRNFYEWNIELFDGNQPSWLTTHLPKILEIIRAARSNAGFDGPDGLRVIGSDGTEIAHFISQDDPGASRFLGIPIGTEFRLCIDGQTYRGTLQNGQLKVGNRSPYGSFTAAYQDIAGRSGNAWKAWELRLPGSSEWIQADEFRQRRDGTGES